MTTRRFFLKSAGVGLAAFGLGSGSPGFLQRVARAAPGPTSPKRRKVLVSIFQRGAMDALGAAPPIDDRHLERARPRLWLDASRRAGSEALIDLDNGFGLHPSLRQLTPMFREQRLAIVHGVGSPNKTRSHFDAQDYMESGTPGRKGTSSGWLNRVVGELGHEGSPFRAVALTSALPRSLYGEHSAVAVSRLEDFRVGLPGARRAAVTADAGFEALYEEAQAEILRDTATETFEAVDVLEKLDIRRYRPAATYPRGPLADALRQIAFLIKSDVGLEVAFAETGGWDTHVRQGGANGNLSQRLEDLAESMSAFWRDLGPYQDDVVVMTMTEFGRTVAENGSGGTDHGHGSCLFVLGNEIDGGRVIGGVPSLHPDALHEGRDLPVTTDFRSVFSEVSRRHLGVEDVAEIFPGWNGDPIEIFRA